MQKNLTDTFNNKQLIALIFFSSIILYFIFSPAINILYYAHDDFRYTFGRLSKTCVADDGFQFMLTLGRPLQAYLDCLNFKFAYTFQRMELLRIFSVVLMGCGMGLLIEWLCYLRLSIGIAFFAAGCLYLLPEMYIDAIFTGSQPLPFAIILVLFAYKFINKFENTSQDQFKWLVASACFILLSILTYPAMAFFFATLIFSKLLFSKLGDWSATRKQIFQEISIFLIVCVIYYIYAYINIRFFPQAPVTDKAYQLNHPNLNLVEMFNRIRNLGNIFNQIWALSPLSNMLLQGWTMLVLCVSGCVIGTVQFFSSTFYRTNPTNALRVIIQVVLMGIGLFLLCSAFTLVMPKAQMEPRLLVGPLTAGLMFLFWCIWRMSLIFSKNLHSKVMLIMLAAFFLIQGYQTNMVAMVRALSYKEFLSYPKTFIANYIATGNKLARIHYIVPRDSYPYDKFFLTNGALMQLMKQNSYQLQWCSLPRGTEGEEKDHQTEALACIKQWQNKAITITYTYPNEHYNKSDSMLVIDMKNITVENYVQQFSQRYLDRKLSL